MTDLANPNPGPAPGPDPDPQIDSRWLPLLDLWHDDEQDPCQCCGCTTTACQCTCCCEPKP
jgi:hypothetical protein